MEYSNIEPVKGHGSIVFNNLDFYTVREISRGGTNLFIFKRQLVSFH